MKRLAIASVVCVVVGIVLSLFLRHGRIEEAWNAAATFGVTTTLGGFLLGAVLVCSGATWAPTMRRVYEAVGSALPVACLAFIPLLHLSHWPVLDVLYLLVTIGLEEWSRSRSLRNHGPGGGVSAVGIVVTSILMTIFFDDVPLAPSRPWVSDMFGLYVLVAAFGGATAITAVAAAPARDVLRLTSNQASALGRVALVATCLWGYVAFAMFMLIWIADLPREVPFYVPRTQGGWGWLFVLLAIGRFGVPFLLLVPRGPKRHWKFLGALGVLVFVMHAVDCEMLVVPSKWGRPSILDVGPFLVVGGVCAIVALLRFRRHEPLPADDEVTSATAYEAAPS